MIKNNKKIKVKNNKKKYNNKSKNNKNKNNYLNVSKMNMNYKFFKKIGVQLIKIVYMQMILECIIFLIMIVHLIHLF